MNTEEILQKATLLLDEYRLSDNENTIDEKLVKLEESALTINHSTDESVDLVRRLLARHCSENFTPYCALFKKHGDSSQISFCGNSSFHERVVYQLEQAEINSGFMEVAICYEEKDYTCSVYSWIDGGYECMMTAVQSSPLFSREKMKSCAHEYHTLVSCTCLSISDYIYQVENLREWMSKQGNMINLFWYQFNNIYTIFEHLGVNRVEKIFTYIFNRLTAKYPRTLRIFQFSPETYFVFFSPLDETFSDKKIVFKYNEITIPYKVKKIIQKGDNNFDKLYTYIHEGVT